MRPVMRSDEEPRRGRGESTYSQRLQRLQTAWWKRLLDVQRPYRERLRALEPGFVLEVGCGIGRNLSHLQGHAVGVDIDRESVSYVVEVLGLRAFTPDSFAVSEFGRGCPFDTLLLSHLLEHLDADGAIELMRDYLPRIKPGGRVIVIAPQEAGFTSDPTHVRFVDEAAVRTLAAECGLVVEALESFPFPRFVGRFFRYNEFVCCMRLPSPVPTRRAS